MVERIVRQLKQGNEKLTGNVLKTILTRKQGQRTNMRVLSSVMRNE